MPEKKFQITGEVRYEPSRQQYNVRCDQLPLGGVGSSEEEAFAVFADALEKYFSFPNSTSQPLIT